MTTGPIQFFVDPSEDEQFGWRRKPFVFSGGGFGSSRPKSQNAGDSKGRRHVQSMETKMGRPELLELLGEAVSMPSSTDELGAELAMRISGVVKSALTKEYGVSVGDVLSTCLVETTYERARAQLSDLMSSARENHVACFTKRASVDEAVVIVEPKALYLLIELAEQALGREEHFGDFVTETISPREAAALSGLEIHRPLPHRQSASERRALLEAALWNATEGEEGSAETSSSG